MQCADPAVRQELAKAVGSALVEAYLKDRARAKCPGDRGRHRHAQQS